MSQPDGTKKVVDQTGYSEGAVAPFKDNYRDLYRELLEENMRLKDKIEKCLGYLKTVHNMLDEEIDNDF